MSTPADIAGDEVPAIEPLDLGEVRDVVGATIKTRHRRRADVDPAMTTTEISRRAADFLELRTSGMFRRRA